MTRAMRDSGVGWLGDTPTDWNVVPSRALFGERKTRSSASDIHLTPSQKYGVLPQSQYMEITGNKVVLNLSGSDNMRHVEPGDYISHLRSFQGGLEHATLSGKVSAAYTVLKPKMPVDARYFKYLFKSALYVQALQTTTDQLRDGQSIRFGEFSLIPLPYPPIAEQRAVADFLDRETAQIDAFIAKNEELITLLTERRAAAIKRAVTQGIDTSTDTRDSGVSWLGEIARQWKLVRTRYLCRVGTGSGDTVDAVASGAYPFYVRSDVPQRSDRFDYEGEAVLTSGDGAGVGKVFHLVDGKFAAHQRVYVMHDFDEVTPSFFYYFFSTFFASVSLDGSAKSTVDSVRRHMIADLPVCVPSAEEQDRIVEYIRVTTAKIDRAIEGASRVVMLARERRAALISAAVTGKIDVGVSA